MAKKLKKMEEKLPISLQTLKQKIIEEDPNSWSVEFLQKCLSEVKLSISGTKEVLVKRVTRLKNPVLLDKLIEKRLNTFRFQSHLSPSDVPRPEAPWVSDSTLYPKVTRNDIKQYQKLKRQGSEGQYRKALRMFNSRKVKTVKVHKEGNNVYVKAHIYKSFTSTTNSGVTRPAVVLFRDGKPFKGHCECAIGLSGLCCHVICLLIYLEHFTKYGVKFLALTCTQKIQRWHKKGKKVQNQTQLCHVPLSHLRNMRSSRKSLESSRKKRKINTLNNQVITEDSMEKSDWMKRDTDEMVSKIKTGILETGINVEDHIYATLKSHGVKSGLFGQLNYNYHYRLKQALQDHSYAETCLYEEHVLKAKFPNHQDVWHTPLIPSNDTCTSVDQQQQNIMEQPGTETLATVRSDAPEIGHDKPMYEHREIYSYIEQLQQLIDIAKDKVVKESKGKTEKGEGLKNINDQQDLNITIPSWPEVKPYGFNYHDVKQNSQEWLNLRIGRVTCSVVGLLIGLAGEKEHLHYLTCIKNNIDPNKVKPKKFNSFLRGQQFEDEARKAFESSSKVPNQ